MVPWYKRRKNWMDKIPSLEEAGPLVIHREAWGGYEEIKCHQILFFPIMFIFLKMIDETPSTKFIKTNAEKLTWLQKRQREKGNKSDIRQNFILGNDGYVYEGRGWEARPDLEGRGYSDFPEIVAEDLMCTPLAARSLFIGYFPGITDEVAGPKMMRAKDALIKYGIKKEYIHRKYVTYNL